jgi:cation transport ATPase
MSSSNFIIRTLSCSHQFLSVKLGGGAEEGGDKAKGLMAFCIMLNLFCMMLVLQSLTGLKLTVFSDDWVKIVTASLVYFLGCTGVGYAVQANRAPSFDDVNVGGFCSVLTSLWVLGSIFVIVPFSLYLVAFH